MVPKDVDTMWFLPSALNVNVKKFNQARVNGGSNYDSTNTSRTGYRSEGQAAWKAPASGAVRGPPPGDPPAPRHCQIAGTS